MAALPSAFGAGGPCWYSYSECNKCSGVAPIVSEGCYVQTYEQISNVADGSLCADCDGDGCSHTQYRRKLTYNCVMTGPGSCGWAPGTCKVFSVTSSNEVCAGSCG